MNRQYCVYKHTCPNGKVYIGITKQGAKRRWGNGHNYARQKLFYSAIKKYGWENIKHEILYNNINEKQAKEIEKKLIKEYKSFDSEYGYNLSLGGEGTSGYKASIETRKKLSLAHKGQTPYNKGVPMSEEQKMKIKATRKRKPVLCLETNTIYESILAASKINNIEYSNILKCLKHKKYWHTAGGYHWEYVIKEEA